MKINIRIDSEVSNNKRAVFINEELSHHIKESEIQEVLKEARLNSWKSSEKDGRELGSRLFHLFNGSGGQLSSLLNKSYNQGDSLYLYFDIPFELDALPVELVFDKQFLLLNAQTHIIRNVTDRNRLKDVKPERRMLRMLFMACAPIDLQDAVLQFEREEESILIEVERFPVDMRIEDSGSLNGLEDDLYEANGYDVVHITGHAGIDPELGPVFYMENDIGGLDKVTPDKLWEKLKSFPPRLLFLSGCNTGKSDKVNVSESFGYLMVEKGISIVLGWGLPVSDVGATLLAAELYKYLGMGKRLDEAVQGARQTMEKQYHPWPLLRLFTDGSQLAPLIAPGQTLRPKTPRKTIYKFLSDSEVKVLESGFVGRRREIQNGLRVLKGYSDKFGLLIRGPAGVGKSCLAGKLIERLSERQLMVIHGELKKADILQKLRHLFDRKGLKSGHEVINSDIEFEDKIKELFRFAFQELPTLIYFDDFEQNLVRHGDDYYIKPEVIETLKPFLYAIEWSEGKTNLLITSRYQFVMEVEGKNLPAEKLEEITLMSFKDADLEKKKKELRHISESAHTDLYMEFGKGNPRLMEWLEQIAAKEDQYNLDALKQALKGKSEEYISEYLAEIMAKTEGEDFHHFLHRAAVFRQPVQQSAFESFSTKELLDKGVNLTLFEREQTRGHEPVYWVMPIIRDSEWNKLTEEEKVKMHQLAYAWYDANISKSDLPDYRYLEETVYHALESDNIRGACKHAIHLGNYLSNLLLYRDSMLLQQGVADRITNEVVEEAVKEKDENVPVLLNNLGAAWRNLGEAKKAIEYYNKALEIDLSVYGDKHPNVALRYNNLGTAWSDLGEAKKAIEYFNKALEIDLAVYGDKHPNVALRYNNLGEAWRNLGEAKKAIEYFNKALEIDLSVYGDKHPNVAFRYYNLGVAWSNLGEAKKAIEYYNKALEIFTAVYGSDHPYTRTVKSNLDALKK